MWVIFCKVVFSPKKWYIVYSMFLLKAGSTYVITTLMNSPRTKTNQLQYRPNNMGKIRPIYRYPLISLSRTRTILSNWMHYFDDTCNVMNLHFGMSHSSNWVCTDADKCKRMICVILLKPFQNQYTHHRHLRSPLYAWVDSPLMLVVPLNCGGINEQSSLSI